jgi:hypothetical protein
MCFECIDWWKVNCGIFNFNNNNDFCTWLLEQTNHTGFAHNLKANDRIFIVDNPLSTDSLPK